MAKEKVKIVHKLFIPWILEDYDEHKIYEAWNSGEKIKPNTPRNITNTEILENANHNSKKKLL